MDQQVGPGFLAGGGETGALMRAHDWSASPLGEPSAWPPSLRTLVGVALGSKQPMLIVWGPEHTTLYNDGYAAMCGARHPAALGRSFGELWHDIWPQVEPILQRAFAGEATHMDDIAFVMHRNGRPEETHFAFGYTPVRGEAGEVAGMFCACTEITEQVLAGRRAAEANAALRRSEARNRQILDSALDYAIVATDLDGRVTRWNEGACRVLGWTEQEMLGQLVDRFFTPKDVADGRVQVEMRDALETGRGTDERWHQRKDGERFWASGEMTVLRDEGGNAIGFVKVLRDRTEQRLAGQRLQASEQRLRELNEKLEARVAERTAERDRMWETSPDLMLVVDFDGVFRRVNPAWTTLLGYAPEELVGHHVNEFVVPDDHRRTTDAYELAAEGGWPTIENRYWHKDGSLRWISWVAAPAGNMTYATGRDMTAEREREAALRDSQDFSRLALSALGGVGVWTYDVATDRFTCDAAISELYGIDAACAAAGIRRESFLANVHPDDLPRLRATMTGGLVHCGDLELEYRLRHPNGSVRWVLSRGHTYFDDAGKPIRRTGVGIETTKQRQLEEQLRQSQKMEAVGQLTGGLAHDFNNLLAGISGSLELLQARVTQGRLGDLERYLVAAQGAAKRAAALTHRLLAFSRRQTLDPKPTDVNRLVAGMEELVRRTVGPEVAVEAVAAGGLWTTLVDPNQLENALLNLCVNARDAMPGGGRLTIETGNKWLDERAARERDLAPGQYVSLCVSDTGTGMAPDVTARAFDPFFTTKPIGMGTGLGLSMVYGFARQSGGQARIYSEPGQGALVCLYLPRHFGDAESTELPAELAGAPRAEQGETVLVVDDEPTVRMLVTEVLEDLGYTAVEAADGTAGLQVLQSDIRIDLLVTDVGLPGMNGRQLADAARVARPDLKVLFITGYAENAVLSHGHLDPGMHVLTKPFAMEALASRIKELIAGT